MPADAISFEMTDALVEQAVREECVAFAREHWKLRDVLVIAASAAIFVGAVRGNAHWLWWIAGLPPAIFALLLAGWLLAYLGLPAMSARRLARLAHRQVTVEIGGPVLAIQTAAARLEVNWNELKALKRLPGFCLICLRSGTKIPVPLSVLPPDAITALQSRLETRA